MTIKICAKMCNECPFSNKSMKGFLADYTIEDILAYMQTDTLFPCHKLLPDHYDKHVSDINKLVNNGTYKLCRGYAESMIKSCNNPKNPELKAILVSTKSNLSENSMSMWNFKEHHNR